MRKEAGKAYQVTAVRLPADIKRRIRMIAAEKDTSICDIAGEFLMAGLLEYERKQVAGGGKGAA